MTSGDVKEGMLEISLMLHMCEREREREREREKEKETPSRKEDKTDHMEGRETEQLAHGGKKKKSHSSLSLYRPSPFGLHMQQKKGQDKEEVHPERLAEKRILTACFYPFSTNMNKRLPTV